ncbi:MAG: alpha-glycosidase [Clostridiaceae bacterium]|nr:alpha-glycosidase [Clostridiaceae bacterium]
MEHRINWKQSIYSDTSENFISNPLPRMGDEVKIRIRIWKDAPVTKVILRYISNGTDKYIPMELEESSDIFNYYAANIRITESVIHYHFIIGTDNNVYYYNQFEVTDYYPTEDHDFKILADFQSPEWVKSSVFYQIFPDRFCNSNPDNDVQDGEYSFDGYKTSKRTWEQVPAEYEESHCLDFFGGDLEGIRKKIPYLKSLGINAIYINPIFMAATNHKYDCIDYFNVDPHFGGNSALQELVKDLHENGIKVILDVSINHTGTAHKWFNKDGEFFDRSIGAFNNPDAPERSFYYINENNEYDCWFGVRTLPTLNYTSEALRNIIYRSEDSVVRKWLKPPFNIDGWRFDVAFCMARRDEIQLHHEVWTEIRKVIKETNPDAYILCEHWTDYLEFMGGKEWDASMNYFGFTRPARQFAGEQDIFVNRLSSYGIKQSKANARQIAKIIRQHMARLPYEMALLQFNLIDSHDIHRLHNNPEVSFERYCAVVKMLFTYPGTPSIYYGDEVGIGGHLGSDPGCRYPMIWEEEKQNKEYFDLYKTLCHLRTTEKALQTGGFKFLYIDEGVLSYARFTLDKAFIFVASMDLSDREVEIPADTIGLKHSSCIREVFGKDSITNMNGTLKVRLKPEESLLIECFLN